MCILMDKQYSQIVTIQMKKNLRLILGAITLLIIIINFYTVSYVINYGNYPIWWNVVFIIIIMLIILAFFKFMSKESKINWKTFFITCSAVFLVFQLYNITMIEY